MSAVAAPAVLTGLSLDVAHADAAIIRPPGARQYTTVVPWHGRHQAGVTTDQQNSLVQAAFDLTVHDAAGVIALLRRWQPAIAALTAGHLLPGYDLDDELFPSPGELRAAPVDTGESDGQGPDELTVTIGFGTSLFDRRFGLAAQRPSALIELPKFRHDALKAGWSGGDLGVQICANTRIVAEHALRSLVRLAAGRALPRWVQTGFYENPTRGDSPTPRNLMGFRDGTANLDPGDAALMDTNVWVQTDDGPSWMVDGTYQVFRRIEINLRKWDDSSLNAQQNAVGRYKASGAPFGGVSEFDAVNVAAMGAGAHVRLANPRTGLASERERILRRSYSFHTGYDYHDGAPLGGLHFICFQRDPRTQFVTIQDRLSKSDLLHHYLTHTGSALFAIPPGVAVGDYAGQALFEG